jgi:hypothetical protein
MFKGASFSSILLSPAAITSMLVGAFFFAQNLTFQWQNSAPLKDLWKIPLLIGAVPYALISGKKNLLGCDEYFNIIDFTVYPTIQIITSVIMTGLTFVALTLLPALPTALASVNLKFLPGMTPYLSNIPTILIASAIGGLLAYFGIKFIPHIVDNTFKPYYQRRDNERIATAQQQWENICSKTNGKLWEEAQSLVNKDINEWSFAVLEYALSCFDQLSKEFQEEVDLRSESFTFLGKTDDEIQTQYFKLCDIWDTICSKTNGKLWEEAQSLVNKDINEWSFAVLGYALDCFNKFSHDLQQKVDSMNSPVFLFNFKTHDKIQTQYFKFYNLWETICSKNQKLLQQAQNLNDINKWNLEILEYALRCFTSLQKEFGEKVDLRSKSFTFLSNTYDEIDTRYQIALQQQRLEQNQAPAPAQTPGPTLTTTQTQDQNPTSAANTEQSNDAKPAPPPPAFTEISPIISSDAIDAIESQDSQQTVLLIKNHQSPGTAALNPEQPPATTTGQIPVTVRVDSDSESSSSKSSEIYYNAIESTDEVPLNPTQTGSIANEKKPTFFGSNNSVQNSAPAPVTDPNPTQTQTQSDDSSKEEKNYTTDQSNTPT